MKKIYIAGAGGMLGDAFYKIFKKNYLLKCTDIDVNSDWLDFLDFRDRNAYEKDVFDFSPDYLFHLGAYTNLEFCELNPDQTYITNTLSVENAVNIANKLNIPILYISTAGIFDGQQDTYDDWSEPNPLGVYARSKYMGEKYVQNNSNKYIICRAGWMMGGGPKKDKKFVNKIMNQIRLGNKELNIVDDKLGTPTYTLDFAKNVELIMELEYWGLYNLVCKGITSRLEVGQKIIEVLNLQQDIKLNSVPSDFFKKDYFAPRPYSERLLTKKIDLRQINIMRTWELALKDYINEYYSDLIN
jgi:dTDP-4-dehydrorhamnose reductase